MPLLDAPIPTATPRSGLARAGSVVLNNISWELYQALLSDLQGQRMFLTYDRGVLEIMAPSPRHEKTGKFIARLVETLTLELRIPVVGLGNTTWFSARIRRGLEADECYYVARAAWAAGREEFDLRTDPPPDLAIEVDITRSSLEKEDIYRELGVPELWRHDGGKLVVRRLDAGGYYETIPQSAVFPMLPSRVIEDFVARRRLDDTALALEFQDWIRANLKAS